MASRSSGFTLIEIMLVVGLVGIIAATALAPLVYTVDSLGAAQKAWNTNDRERLAAENIFNDVRRAVPNQSFQSVKIIHQSGLSSVNDDRLLVWSSAPAREGRSVCLVVYKIIAVSSFSDKKGGLYRWLINAASSGDVTDTVPSSSDAVMSSDAADYLSGDLKLSTNEAGKKSTPMDTDTEALKPEDGKLVLAGVDGLGTKALLGREWTDEYEGSMPPALRITFTVKDKTYQHEEWFPQSDAK
jgi:prepilin-type N-terminal cleavage/methylation domain-containing protein